MGQGLIENTDRQVWELFPERQGRRWIDEQYNITLWHVLTMSANIDWNELVPYTDPKNSNIAMNMSDDWIGYVLDRPIAGEPGLISSYTSGLSILLGGVIHNVTGQYVDHYAEKTLFADLGISHYRWFSAPDGTRHTGGGLNLVARDFAKTGQLVLSEGRWQDKQVVPSDWIEESTKLHLPVIGERQSRGMIGYGFQWWHMRFGFGDETADAILASGYGGQMLAIFPQWDLLIVTNGGEYGYVEKERPVFSYTRLLESGILQAVSGADPE
jgi:CubicO group peptidase (beta-lactamase class C family)